MGRRVRRVVAVVMLCAVGLVACSSDESGSTSTSTTTTAKSSAKTLTLVGPTWVLASSPSLGASLDGLDVYAQFADGRITGKNGCNNYSGAYTASGSELTISSSLTSTLIGCRGAAATVETAYMARLPRTQSYEIHGERLTLLDRSGTVLLGYTASTAADLNGNWNVTSYYTGSAIQSVNVSTALTAKFTTNQASGTQVSGNSGCNTYSGKVATTGNDGIAIGPLAVTQRACVDNAVNEQEQHYLAALELATTYRVTRTRLELFRADGGFAATFERAS